MKSVMQRTESDFSSPIEADFVVALKAKSGKFELFVEAFLRKNGKGYLRHTADIREAMRFSKFKSFEIADQVEEYRCTGRVERVSHDGLEREVLMREAVVGILPSPHSDDDNGATGG